MMNELYTEIKQKDIQNQLLWASVEFRYVVFKFNFLIFLIFKTWYFVPWRIKKEEVKTK